MPRLIVLLLCCSLNAIEFSKAWLDVANWVFDGKQEFPVSRIAKGDLILTTSDLLSAFRLQAEKCNVPILLAVFHPATGDMEQAFLWDKTPSVIDPPTLKQVAFAQHPLRGHIITHEGGGRFGDQLIAYLHAKWLSYKYHIPLQMRSFALSSLLALHRKEQMFASSDRPIVHYSASCFDVPRKEATTFICDYFPESSWELERTAYEHFSVPWEDPSFRQMAKGMIAPKKSVRVFIPPRHTVNIAIHVRDGGTVDHADIKLVAPLKLPPLSYYTEALQKVTAFFPHKPIYCQVFTDAVEPMKIVNELKKVLPENATIHFRASHCLRKKQNVLRDFFSLAHFDILIRPESNFSLVPTLLQDFALVYFPVDAKVEGDHVIIHKVDMQIHPERFEELLFKEKPWWQIL